MLKIAICDDEKEIVFQVSNLIKEYFDKTNLKYNIFCFVDPDKFIKSDLSSYDIIFLDIKLNNNNGIDIAKKINLLNNKAIIMLISQFYEYLPEGYKVKAFRYILKPDLNIVFKDDMDSALAELNLKEGIFEYKVYSDIFRESYNNIVYFESNYPKIYIKTVSPIRQPYFNGSIDEISNNLSGTEFIRIGKSYLVNAKYIKKISNMKAYLYDGEYINVSRDYIEQAKNNLLRIKRSSHWNI